MRQANGPEISVKGCKWGSQWPREISVKGCKFAQLNKFDLIKKKNYVYVRVWVTPASFGSWVIFFKMSACVRIISTVRVLSDMFLRRSSSVFWRFRARYLRKESHTGVLQISKLFFLARVMFNGCKYQDMCHTLLCVLSAASLCRDLCLITCLSHTANLIKYRAHEVTRTSPWKGI